MFLMIDDRIINADDISLIEPNTDDNTLVILYRGTEAVTTVQYDDTNALIEGLKKFVRVLEPAEIPGTLRIVESDTSDIDGI